MSSSWDRTVTGTGGLSSAHGEALFRHAGGSLARSPADALAARLFCEAFGWQPCPALQMPFDARSDEGQRYCIRGREVSAFDTSGKLSPIRGASGDAFDYLAAALFDANGHVLRAVILPGGLIPEFASFERARNVHIVHMTETLCDDARARDVTSDIAALSP